MSRSRTLWVLIAMLGVYVVHGIDWPHQGGTADRSRQTAEVLGLPFSLDWSAPLPGGGVSTPTVGDGRVVAGTRSGAVRAYRENGGALDWVATTGDEVIASPLIDGGRVLIPSTDRTTRILAVETGAQIQSILTGGTEMSSPVAVGGTTYMGLGFPNQHVRAFGGTTWQTPLEQLTYSSPAVANGRVYIGCDSGRYYALDQADGSVDWTFLTAGSVLLSSPLAIGNEIFLLPGGGTNLLYRVHDDPLQWGTNWTYAVPEPALAYGGWFLERRRPVSSPSRAGTLVVFVMRFDDYFDVDMDWVLDTIHMREYLVAVDPATQTAAWAPIQISDLTVSSPNQVPQLSLCPTPAAFPSPGGGILFAVASTLVSSVAVYDTAGTLQQTLGIDLPTRASPTVANAHLYVATPNTLYAFRCGTNFAPAPVSNPPASGEANVFDSTPALSWNPPSDDDATLVYSVRADTDGEVLLDWQWEFTTATTSVDLPQFAPDTRITWGIRSQDPKGAFSPWAVFHFWVNRNTTIPAPPTNFEAIPGDGQITLVWTASSSPDVVGHLLYVDYGPVLVLGNVTTTAVTGLTNGVTYTFTLAAKDVDGYQSPLVETTGMPMVPVALNGAAMPSLASAVGAANPGDTIQLSAGTFAVGSTLDLKEGVTLAGWAPHRTTISGPGTILRVVSGSGTASIRRLGITGGSVGVDANGFAVELRNVVLFELMTGALSAGGSTMSMLHCTVVNNTLEGIHIFPSSFAARNCLVTQNPTGIAAEIGATPALTYNDVVGNTTDYLGAAPGTGSTSAAVTFLDEANDDYREPDLSAVVDAGDPADPFDLEPSPNGGRANQGAFGNTPWAARSAVPPQPQPPEKDDGDGCGLLGLEAILALLLLGAARRRTLS